MVIGTKLDNCILAVFLPLVLCLLVGYRDVNRVGCKLLRLDGVACLQPSLP